MNLNAGDVCMTWDKSDFTIFFLQHKKFLYVIRSFVSYISNRIQTVLYAPSLTLILLLLWYILRATLPDQLNTNYWWQALTYFLYCRWGNYRTKATTFFFYLLILVLFILLQYCTLAANYFTYGCSSFLNFIVVEKFKTHLLLMWQAKILTLTNKANKMGQWEAGFYHTYAHSKSPAFSFE